jgi:hypothetical protein
MAEKTQTGASTKEAGKGDAASEGENAPATERKARRTYSRKGGRVSSRKATRTAARKASPAADKNPDAFALVTEKPVPSTPVKGTSQYVVTIDNRTMLPVRIEKLNEDTGERKELSKEEYAQSYSYASTSPLPSYAGLSGTAPVYSSSEATALVQAYYQGVVEYFKALLNAK